MFKRLAKALIKKFVQEHYKSVKWLKSKLFANVVSRLQKSPAASKKFFQEHYQNAKLFHSLDPDQDQHSIAPDLVSNCLQRLSADNRTSH